MFTGIIEAVGVVRSVEEGDGTRSIRIDAPETLLEGVSAGDSIAIDGACLTPTRVGAAGFEVDVVGTTLSRTIVGAYSTGRRVNLERALALGDRLDGHLVQGHVDGVGYLKSIREAGRSRMMELSLPDEIHAMTIPHGSIAINGVSLTVNRLLDDGGLEVALIPHTWSETNFRYLSQGDLLNLEGDLIGKYVGRLLRGRLGSSGSEHEPIKGEED